MASSPWREINYDECSITFKPFTTATLEQQQAWFEKKYTDRHWIWRGFGEVGTEGFHFVLLRRGCWRINGEGPKECAWCDGESEDE